jgi:hypothetical protein
LLSSKYFDQTTQFNEKKRRPETLKGRRESREEEERANERTIAWFFAWFVLVKKLENCVEKIGIHSSLVGCSGTTT